MPPEGYYERKKQEEVTGRTLSEEAKRFYINKQYNLHTKITQTHYSLICELSMDNSKLN